jgi:hypothetical protein
MFFCASKKAPQKTIKGGHFKMPPLIVFVSVKFFATVHSHSGSTPKGAAFHD